jgi:flagellar motility protein MotE (MotC chaperone)
MGESKMDLIISIIKNIKKEKTSEILAAMKPEFASKLTEKMSQLYIPAKK